MTHRIFRNGLTISAVGMALAVMTGCKETSTPSATAVQGPPPTVTVVEANLSEVTRSVSYSGRVEAVDTVELRARVQGFLEERKFEEGANVEAGDLLFVIEKDTYEAQVKAAAGAIERLEGTHKLALIERDRREALVKKNVIAQEEADTAVARVSEASGDLLAGNARMDKAKLDLSYTEIKAPISGRIGFSAYSKGDYVGPASGALATIVSQDPMYVTFPVSQKELLEAVADKDVEADPESITARIRLANGKLYEPTGTINFIDVSANPGTDTVTLRAEFANPDGLLIHQQLVNISLEESTAEMLLTIPQDAVQMDQTGSYVLVVNDEQKVQVQRIRTGVSTGNDIVVTEGLEEKQRVITVGVQKVRPGSVVNPEMAGSTGS